MTAAGLSQRDEEMHLQISGDKRYRYDKTYSKLATDAKKRKGIPSR